MSTGQDDPMAGWFSLSDLAAGAGCSEATILELARTNHWPRIYSLDAVEIAVTREIVGEALTRRQRAGSRHART